MTSPRIVRAGLERVDDLRPLWQSLHAHHAEVAPHLAALGGVRTPAESWGRRRALYERLGLLPFLVSFIGPVQPANLDGPPTLS